MGEQTVGVATPTTKPTPTIDRATGIGCSELGDVMNEPPYGCRRRLVYSKRGMPPDYPPDNLAVMKRGTALEELVVDRYVHETGRKVVRREPVRHPDYPLIASVDREIVGDPRGVGVLECKTANAHVFRTMRRDGLSAAYLLQMAGYLFTRKRGWGAFAILQPDSWAFEQFEVERDDHVLRAVLPVVEETWRMVEHGPLPPQLAANDRRCARCEYRRTCWGAGLEANLPADDRGIDLETDESLAEILVDLQEAEQYATEAQGTVDTIKTVLRDRLGARQAVQCAGYRVYYRPRPGNARIDRKALEQKHPEIAQEFTVHDRPSRPLRIYPV